MGSYAPTQTQIDKFEDLFKSVILTNFKWKADLDGLTPREMEYLMCLVQIRGNKAISAKLGVKARTLRRYRESILTKTRSKSLHEVIYKLASLSGIKSIEAIHSL